MYKTSILHTILCNNTSISLCHFENCKNTSEQNKFYCKDHLCDIKDCCNKKTLINDTYYLCICHKCYSEDCVGTRISGSRYCKFHKCTYCLHEKITGSEYCYIHYIEHPMDYNTIAESSSSPSTIEQFNGPFTTTSF